MGPITCSQLEPDINDELLRMAEEEDKDMLSSGFGAMVTCNYLAEM